MGHIVAWSRRQGLSSRQVGGLMIVRYHGESSPVELIDGKDYEVLSIEKD